MARFMILFCLIWSVHAMANDSLILGVGASAIDLLIQVDEEFISNHTKGAIGGSTHCDPETIQKFIHESGKEAVVLPGGSAANTIRALAKLGEKCAFFGCVGEDRYGEEFCLNLAQFGVENRLIKMEKIPTAHVLCMVAPGGQRTFRGFDPVVEDLWPQDEHFEKVRWLHMEARRFNHGISAIKALEAANAAHVGVSLDLSSIETVDTHRELLREAISKYVDIVFCNEDEILKMTELEPQRGCLKLQELCPVVVVTLGAKGCMIGHNQQVVHVPAFAAQVIDTTGAGDFFAAGFLYGYLNGKSMEKCGEFGNRLGQFIVEVIGAQLPESKWKTIRELVD